MLSTLAVDLPAEQQTTGSLAVSEDGSIHSLHVLKDKG